MNKVLFTNIDMENFAGSEIATLTLCSHFLSKGWEVHIFTLNCRPPLKDIIDERIKICTVKTSGELSSSYDLIWSHHYPLLDYVLFPLGIKGKRVYHEALTYLLPIECVPVYHKHLSLVGVVSEQSKKGLINLGVNVEDAYIFHNYATQEFFDAPPRKPEELKRIAVISNHVAPELEDMVSLFAEKDIEVDIYGKYHKAVFVDSVLLKDYDVIISIGKTIYYSLAMGIPSYTYDNGVSRGYINMDNFEENLRANFAFRDCYKKKTAHELVDDILTGYDFIQNQSADLKEKAYNRFFFDTMMEQIFQKIMNSNPVDYERLLKDFAPLNYTSRLYVEEIDYYKAHTHNLETIADVLKHEKAHDAESITNLEAQIRSSEAALRSLETEINGIKQSKSWKITKPLRAILRKINSTRGNA